MSGQRRTQEPTCAKVPESWCSDGKTKVWKQRLQGKCQKVEKERKLELHICFFFCQLTTKTHLTLLTVMRFMSSCLRWSTQRRTACLYHVSRATGFPSRVSSERKRNFPRQASWSKLERKTGHCEWDRQLELQKPQTHTHTHKPPRQKGALPVL